MTPILSFQAADGARIAYRDDGAGLPVLALAGLTRDGRDFDYVAPRLADQRLIRMDYRGRGASDRTGAGTYTIRQEAADAVALLDHLGVPRAAIIGSSRGGLIGLELAATHHDRLLGLCLNDIGPVIERPGLVRIAGYVGRPPRVNSLDELAAKLPNLLPGFANVPADRWRDEVQRHYVEADGRIGLTYDPALAQAFERWVTMPDEDWRLFDACAGLPLAVIRGENSDLLARATVDEMARRRPDLIVAEVPDRAHMPFLDEPQSVAAIRRWIARIEG